MRTNTMPTRQESKAATRRKIRDAARAAFREAGVKGVSTTDISESAGVAVGTVYVHFKNKDEIVDEIARSLNLQHRVCLVKAAAENIRSGARSVIRAQVRAHLNFWREHSADLAVFLDYLSRRSPGVPLEARGVNEQIAAFARFAVEVAGVRPVVPPAEIARMVFTLWRQAGLNIAGQPEADLATAEEALTLATIALYEALAPGLVDIRPDDLSAAYQQLTSTSR